MTLPRVTRSAWCAGAVALVAATTAACLPQSVTAESRGIVGLYSVFLVGGALILALVWGLTTFAILRYRRRRPDLPPQVRGSVALEALWTALPALAVLGLFALTLVTLAQVQARSEGGVNLEVRAFRWGWQFTYPQEGVSVAGVTGQTPEVVVPVGEPIHVTLTSADVIHAFYVPAFLYKHDANPGATATFDLTVEQPGTYGGQCAEFCGVYHSRMPFSVRAVPSVQFRAWLSQRRAHTGANL